VDRLIALVALRWRLDLRMFRFAPERAAAALLATPILLVISTIVAVFVFVAVRGLARADSGLLLPVGSLLATALGVLSLLSPLLTGMSLAEADDPTRLLHFPIPLPTLAAASLLSNLFRPAALRRLPVVLAVGAGLAEGLPALPFTLAGMFLGFAFVLATAQASGLLFHALARSRRARDLAIFLGLGFGFALTMMPLLLVSGLAHPLPAIIDRLIERDFFALSPFAWGFRAAVHAGRGEIGPFAAYTLAAAVGVAAVLGAFTWALQRLYRGEVDLGHRYGGAARQGRMPLPGMVGALLEKDLRVTWRDPALKAALIMSLAAPLLYVFFLVQTSGPRGQGRGLLVLAVLVGLTASANAFGFEGRGLALLMSFPVARWRILIAKNAMAFVFRLPGLITLLLAGLLLRSAFYLPAAVTIALCALLVSVGADNYVSILFPTPVPPPGRGVAAARGRGLGAFAFRWLVLVGAFALAFPFLFLAWLPLRLGQPGLWLITLPLALAGSGATYALLLGGAAHLLEKREPELLERILAGAEA
jgi:putative transporter with 12 TMs